MNKRKIIFILALFILALFSSKKEIATDCDKEKVCQYDK